MMEKEWTYMIDGVLVIYDRELTPKEVKELYASICEGSEYPN
jgi:hypothetical protein